MKHILLVAAIAVTLAVAAPHVYACGCYEPPPPCDPPDCPDPDPCEGTLFTGSQGNLSAAVYFERSGNNDLVVTLANTSPHDVLVPADVLQSVYFDLEGVGELDRVSATIADCSTYVFDYSWPKPTDGDVGGEWAYRGDLGDESPTGAEHGISGSGYDMFGKYDRFAQGYYDNLDGPKSPDGMQYGILSEGDDIHSGNSAVTGDNPFIKHAVVFTLSGLPAEFDIANDISNVWFQYGTCIGEPGYPGILIPCDDDPPVIPEPVSAVGMAAALAAAGGYLRKRRVAKR